MKKVVAIFLLVLCLNIKIEALEYDIYYSGYGDYSNFSEEKIDSSELVDVEIERRYKWYKEVVEGDYLVYDEGFDKYDFVNMNEYKWSDYSSWQTDNPVIIEGRNIEERTRYKVNYIKPINSIYISNVNLKKDKVNFGDIEIYSNNKKINTNIFCSDCENGLNLYDEDGFIMIRLDDYYYMEDLIIKILSPETSYINSFNLLITAPSTTEDVENVFFSINYINEDDKDIVINKNNVKVNNPIYEENVIYDYVPSITMFDLIEEFKEYRFQDKLYYFYNLQRQYLDGYYINYEGYKNDGNQYKDFYRYRVRDKVEVKKEIIITDYNNKLEDFINSTTDYDIKTDINYEENGEYYVEYITDFKTIRKEIVVDIMDNELKQELQDITNKYNKLVSDYNLSIVEKEKVTKEYERTIKDYSELLDKYNNAIENLDNENEEIRNNYNGLLNDYNNIISDNNKLKNKFQNLVLDYNLSKDNYDDLVKINNDKYLKLSNENSILKTDISSLKSEYNLCLSDLDKMILKHDDSEKKLKLSNQANDYLKESLLKINNSETIENVNFYAFLFLGLLILVIVIIFLKKKSNKNKF